VVAEELKQLLPVVLGEPLIQLGRGGQEPL